jgi:hypothetical protein
MEPPGEQGGPVRSFGEHRHDEEIHDQELLTALGIPSTLAAKGYCVTIRLGHLAKGIHRLGCTELHAFHVPPSPRLWTQIWPARGTKSWPPTASMKPVIGCRPSTSDSGCRAERQNRWRRDARS